MHTTHVDQKYVQNLTQNGSWKDPMLHQAIFGTGGRSPECQGREITPFGSRMGPQNKGHLGPNLPQVLERNQKGVKKSI